MSVKRYSYRKDGNVKLSAHFAVREFRCADGTDTVLIDDALVTALERIRAHFGKPVRISSAYRTVAHCVDAATGAGGRRFPEILRRSEQPMNRLLTLCQSIMRQKP